MIQHTNQATAMQSDSCAGCPHLQVVGQRPASWRYCDQHVTPFARCANHPGSTPVALKNRLAGGLQCR